MDFLDELAHQVLPGDGAMGTLLIDRGIPLGSAFEELSVSHPEMVCAVHIEYIAAGARVIGTNSFGGNALRLAKHGLEHRVSELNWSAAQLARDCAKGKGKGVYVAGSVGPLGISAEQAQANGIDRRELFNEQIGALLDGGAQLIFFETFTDLAELLLAHEVKQSLHHCPAICSLACNESGILSDGTTLAAAFAALRAHDVGVVGVNCVNGPQATVQLLREVAAQPPLAAFPNAGLPRFDAGRYLYFTTPEYFARCAIQLAEIGVRFIGGCCGTTPAHIARMCEALDARPAAWSGTIPSITH